MKVQCPGCESQISLSENGAIHGRPCTWFEQHTLSEILGHFSGGPPMAFPVRHVLGDYKVRELLDRGRLIWGNHRYRIDEIVVRLMVGVGDLARLARSSAPTLDEYQHEVKKELGNVIFSTIRWCDDLGFDVIECLALAIEAQKKFATSGKPR